MNIYQNKDKVYCTIDICEKPWAKNRSRIINEKELCLTNMHANTLSLKIVTESVTGLLLVHVPVQKLESHRRNRSAL